MAPSGLERIDNVRGERQFENRLHPRDVKLSEAMATSAAVVSFHMGEYETSIDPVQSLQIMLGLGMGKSIAAEPERCPKLLSMVLSLHYFFNNFIGLDHKDYKVYMLRGEQGWRSGENTYLPPMWPGFDSRSRRNMWVEFVVGSRPCSQDFLRVLRFSSLHKNQHFKFQFELETVERRATPWIPLKFPFFLILLVSQTDG